jgi:hypothetical protein
MRNEVKSLGEARKNCKKHLRLWNFWKISKVIMADNVLRTVSLGERLQAHSASLPIPRQDFGEPKVKRKEAQMQRFDIQ